MESEWVTVSVDRAKIDAAMALTRTGSAGEVIDLALDLRIRAEHLRRDVAAYRAHPVSDAEVALAEMPVIFDLDDPDVDDDAHDGAP